MPYRLGLCVLRWTCRQDNETPLYFAILHNYHHQVLKRFVIYIYNIRIKFLYVFMYIHVNILT
jgi:hypothetical protein